VPSVVCIVAVDMLGSPLCLSGRTGSAGHDSGRELVAMKGDVNEAETAT
jgi:hypothetical protein